MKKRLIASICGVTLLMTPVVTKADTVASVKEQLLTVNKQLDEKSQLISELLEKISVTDKNIQQTNDNLEKLKANLSKQAQDAQLNSSTQWLDVLLSSKSFSDKLAEWQNMQLVADSNKRLIDDLKSTEQELLALQKDNEASKNQLEEEKLLIEEQLTELEGKLSQLEEDERLKAQQQLTANKSVVASLTTTTVSSNATYAASDARSAFEQITAEKGLSSYQKSIWADIITKESGWRTTVWNSGGSGAYGLGQALPASKMAAYGSDYMTNPYTQLQWMYDYIMGRYGSFENLAAFWAVNHWY